MTSTKQRVARATCATAVVASLVGVGLAATSASADINPGTDLKVAITKYGLYLNGPTTFPAGRLKLTVDASGGERGVEIIAFKSGYSFQDFRGDLKIAFQNLFAPNGDKKKGLRHLNKAIDHILSAPGGLYAHEGQRRHGYLLLNHPGADYVLYDDSGNLPKRPVHLTVTAPAGPQTLPATKKTVVARTDRRFGGDDVLPAHGNITFTNKSTESPHFLSLQHVKDGTTRKQVIQGLESNDFSFGLEGSQDADVVGKGESMVLHLNLPPGTYAEMCFFPDPKTGMPHAFMGMVRIVHLVK
jgi:hypothetical protein